MKRLLLFSILPLSLFINRCSKDSSGTSSTGIVTVVPVTPGNLTAIVASPTQVNLSWTDNSTNEDGFKIERKTAGGTYALVATVNSNITIYNDISLTPFTTYTYRVYAYNTKGASLSYTNEVTVTVKPKVYVAGSEKIGLHFVAKLWTNGVSTSLTDGSKEAEAFSVFVSGSDVYVAGYENGGTFRVAKVWKNGVATSLTNGSTNATARSVFISGSDVYVAGDINGVATVWKNAVATTLSNGYAHSIFVSGSDVYTVGNAVAGPNIYISKYWKNGVETILTGTNGGANSVFVSGTDVYIAITENSIAKLWKNGVFSTLPNGTSADGVFVSGSDVYVAGSIGGVATVWKNGIASTYTLTPGFGNSGALSVFVWGTHIYASGAEVTGGGGVATIWENGVANPLTNVSFEPNAYGVFVK